MLVEVVHWNLESRAKAIIGAMTPVVPHCARANIPVRLVAVARLTTPLPTADFLALHPQTLFAPLAWVNK